MDEKSYEMGLCTARRMMLLHLLRSMDIKTDMTSLELRVTQLEIERDEAISVMREICHNHGDNDWKDNLHLADILNKHLRNQLEE